jgi:DNA-binding transcriptional MocR family regulator
MSLPDKRDRINHRAPRLLWQQVYDDVLGDIRSGSLALDDRLPSEFDMAEQYGVSRDVIRRAKAQLAEEGWLVVLQGRGTLSLVVPLPPGPGRPPSRDAPVHSPAPPPAPLQGHARRMEMAYWPRGSFHGRREPRDHFQV